ncbi:MAG TPA: PQQ-dependent sugar dehydrogenase [Xanthobacteraceae bacterium]|jgi:glucose/arabinose dehydrogenase|nr:PQQ-dependent sugar dehydrogenase [Xanthobacteraceae bacterium]
MFKHSLAAAALFLSLAAPALAQDVIKSQKESFRVETIASGLENPWALAFLPDGRMLVTERPGRLRIVSKDGKLSDPVANLPKVAAVGQGGLLDIVLAPDFSQSHRLYFTFAEPRGANGAVNPNSTSAASARFVEDKGTAKLEDVKVIFRQEPAAGGGFHFGSRIAIARDGTLFITTGERNLKTPSQDLKQDLGKVIHINADGTIPKDNPFVGRKDARPEIWSYGHRNIQGAAIHPSTGKLWINEHGPKGGDEINIPLAGKNYGWPVIGFGVDYSGAVIHESTEKPGMEQPIHHWTPSIAPSGMAFYTADAFPNWRGNLFSGALALTHLNRIELDGEKVVKEERLLGDLGLRIRDVRQGPDGYLYLLSDARNGKLLRLVPAK